MSKQNITHMTRVRITLRTLAMTIIAGIPSIAICGNTESINDYDNTAYSYGDYYQMKPKGGESINYVGGTIGYINDISNAFSIEGEFTYLSGSTSSEIPFFSNNDYIRYKYTDYYDYKYTEYHAEIMCVLGEKKMFSFGMEYIMHNEELTWEREGTKTTKVPTYKTTSIDDGPETTDYTNNYVLAKSRVRYPVELFSRNNQTILITPALTAGAGGYFGDNESGFAYEGDGKCAISYSYKRHSIVVEGGYRILGTVKDGNNYTTGLFGRAGYAFSW